jgi:integrase
VIGALPVDAVDTGLVLRIIEPLWRTKPETASRIRGRIESVLAFAGARGWRSGPNPAQWRGHLDQLLPKTSRIKRIDHFAALPWREAGAFMSKLRQAKGVAPKCLEFAILSAVRSSEARGATWSEIDLDHAVWTIPATRMKANREHRVPLREPAMAVLRHMSAYGSDGLVFPGRKHDRPLSDVALSKVVKAVSGSDATTHGFRSTFRDWAAEATNFPRELAEAALAHVVRDQTERAYQRGDLLERRRQLMTAWADFCGREMIPAKSCGSHVIRLA